MRLRVARFPRSTPLGRRAGIVGIGLLFAGFNTGNNLFYLVFTVMAACELVGSLAAGRLLRRAWVEVSLPRRGRAGCPMRATVRVRNVSRWLPLPGLCWAVRTRGGERGEIRTPAVPAGGCGAGTGLLVPRGRGLLRLERIEARTDFPVGLARRAAWARTDDVKALVWPSAGELDRRVPDRPCGERPNRSRIASSEPDEPLDAREYLPGDDARRIDWKASARTDRLTLRERRGERPRSLRVRLDRSGVPGQRFERRISRAARTVEDALARGHAVGLASDEWEAAPATGPGQRRRILEYLALVQPHGEPEP